MAGNVPLIDVNRFLGNSALMYCFSAKGFYCSLQLKFSVKSELLVSYCRLLNNEVSCTFQVQIAICGGPLVLFKRIVKIIFEES